MRVSVSRGSRAADALVPGASHGVETRADAG